MLSRPPKKVPSVSLLQNDLLPIVGMILVDVAGGGHQGVPKLRPLHQRRLQELPELGTVRDRGQTVLVRDDRVDRTVAQDSQFAQLASRTFELDADVEGAILLLERRVRVNDTDLVGQGVVRVTEGLVVVERNLRDGGSGGRGVRSTQRDQQQQGDSGRGELPHRKPLS